MQKAKKMDQDLLEFSKLELMHEVWLQDLVEVKAELRQPDGEGALE